MWSRKYRLEWVADPDRSFRVSVWSMPLSSHGSKLIFVHVNTRSCYVYNFVAYLNFRMCLLVHPFRNDFLGYFQRANFNFTSQNLILIWTVVYMLCWIHPFISVQLYRSDLDPAVSPPKPPKWCLDLPSRSPRLPNRHKETKPWSSPRLPHPLPRRWWKTSCPSKSTMDAYFSSFL